MYNMRNLTSLNYVTKIFRSYLSFFLLALFLNVNAQISNSTREYSQRLAINLMGDFDMIGNTNMQCESNCDNLLDWNNPNKIMGYVDIDNDSQTINSSYYSLLWL